MKNSKSAKPSGSRRSQLKKYVAGLAAATAVGAGTFAVTGLPYYVGEQVVSVIDGDSFKISRGQTIRLAGLNAPEIGNCYGDHAKAELTRLILGRKVVLRQPQTDIYRRIMALVYVDGVLVNAHMIKKGLAVSTRESGFETESVKAANDFARNNRLGVFGPECTQISPPDPACTVKGNINDRTGQKQYLTPDCPDYSKTIIEAHWGERWFCTGSQAVSAGFSKSPSCSRKIPKH